jgi:hypothetical protein
MNHNISISSVCIDYYLVLPGVDFFFLSLSDDDEFARTGEKGEEEEFEDSTDVTISILNPFSTTSDEFYLTMK